MNKVALTLGGILSIAGAQSAAAEPGIVVTGERRAQPIAETAPSIAIVDRATLRFVSPDHISEALARAPGVGLHRGSGAEHLTAIRSPVLTGGAGAGSFLFLENGVPMRSPGFANTNGLFDSHYEIANGIEIVRGPSGAAYGANAIHGVINVLSPAPEETFSAFSEIFGDTEDRYKWRAVASGASADHALLLGASVVSEAGYRDDAGLDQQKATLRHIYSGDAVEVDTILSFHNLEQETAGFIFGADTLRDRDARRTNDFPFAYRDAKSFRAQSTITAPLSDDTELRVTPYARWNEMEFPQHFLPSNALENNGHWSVGVQSAVYRDRGALSFIAGVDAEYTEGTLREFQENEDIFSFTQGLHYDYGVRALNASGFVQSEFQASEKTLLSFGLRVDGTIYDYDNRTDADIVGRFLRLPDQVDRFVTASPKVSIRHALSADTNLYASYARGARPPQTTDLYRLQINQTGDQASPEKIDAFELGARSSIGDFATIDLAAYWMEKRNFFFRDADGFNVANGRTRHVGVEANVILNLHPTVTLSSAATYAAHTYRFDRNPASDPGVSVRENIMSGDDVDTAPRIIANTRLAWRPLDPLSFEAEWVSMGAYYTDAANDHRYGGHNLLHLRAEVAASERLSGFITVRNVTNALYAERADFAFGNDRYFPGEERTFGFGLRYER